MNNDMNNKVIISVFSTASMSPKTLYNQNVKVIYLYELEEFFNNMTTDYNMKEIIKKFKEKYDIDNKVVIPKNLNQIFSKNL